MSFLYAVDRRYGRVFYYNAIYCVDYKMFEHNISAMLKAKLDVMFKVFLIKIYCTELLHERYVDS